MVPLLVCAVKGTYQAFCCSTIAHAWLSRALKGRKEKAGKETVS